MQHEDQPTLFSLGFHTVALLLALCLTVAPVSADDEDSSSSSSSEGSHDGNPLHDQMEKIGDAFGDLAKAFRKGPKAENSAQYVKWAESVHELLVACEKMTPAYADTFEGEKRTAMIAGYKKDMAATTATTKKLVDALKKNDFDQAGKLIVELKKLRNDSHGKYQEPDDE